CKFVRPLVGFVIVVHRPVVRALFPYTPLFRSRDRPVPVVDVGERGPLPQLAVLARAGTGDDRSTAVPTRRLPGPRQPASRHERGGRRGAAARGGGARRGRAARPWRRDLEREGSTRSAVPVDDDEI